MSEGTHAARFPACIIFRCPALLPEAVARAADEQLTTSSAYVRQAVVERLRADGFDLRTVCPSTEPVNTACLDD
jgi:hypothetical protein